jgi:acetyl-CoA acetyltransferase
MISTPLCLYDCDLPLDASVCLVVSHADYAKDAPKPAVHVNAVGTAFTGRPDWFYRDDYPDSGLKAAGDQMWARTELEPHDVDVAEVYDSLTYFAFDAIEALGFCPRGEAGRFIEGGRRISLDGELPISTDGGNVSAGRLHGMRHMREAVIQLRHEAGTRQVPDAEVALVSHNGGPNTSCMLLTRGVR